MHARFAVPTADEMRHLRETEQLYSSNVLRLQLDALIEDSTILNKNTGALQQWMRDLKAHLTRTLPRAQQPVHCGVAGSFLSQTCLRGRLNADIVVVMPTPADSDAKGGASSSGLHMSGALFPHVARYALCLADAVKSFCSAEAVASRGHTHICCVVCTPHGAGLSGMERSFTVRMHVIADASKLPHRRFSPSHNNFRPSVPTASYPPTPPLPPPPPRCLLLTLLSYAAWCVSNGRADAPEATDCSTGVCISMKLCSSSALLTDLITAARVERKAREGALTKRSKWRLRSEYTSSLKPKCGFGSVWRQGASSWA